MQLDVDLDWDPLTMSKNMQGKLLIVSYSLADPGFPGRGGTNPRGVTPIYYLTIFCRKLHENERNWTEMRVTCPQLPLPSHDPPLLLLPNFITLLSIIFV